MIALAPTLSLLLAAAPVAGQPPLAGSEPDPVTRAKAAGIPAALAQDVAARGAALGADPAILLAPAIEAALAGLPGQLVAEKVLEGLAKGAPPERISAVSHGLVERLASSRAILDQVERGGIRVADGSRVTVLGDLAGALQEGVPPGALRALVESAQRARAERADGVVSGARTLADLHRRGVAVAEALSLAQAMAGRPGDSGLPDQLTGLYDAWRAEGGQEPRAFLEEARRRVDAGAQLDDMVDHFAESPDRVVRMPRGSGQAETGVGASKGKAIGAGNNGKALGHGDVPGLSDGPPGRGKDKKDKKDKGG